MAVDNQIVSQKHRRLFLRGLLTVVMCACVFYIVPSLTGCRRANVSEKKRTVQHPSLENSTLTKDPDQSEIETIHTLVASEELILALTPRLKALSASVLLKKLPHQDSHDLFAQQVKVTDLSSSRPSQQTESISNIANIKNWPLEKIQQKPLPEISLWVPLFAKVNQFEHAKFSIIRGEFTSVDKNTFQTDVLFSGLAQGLQGNWISVTAEQRIAWKRFQESGTADPWKITDWHLTNFQSIESNRLLFSEVLDQALPQPSLLKRARESEHSRLILKYFAGEAVRLPPGLHDSRFFPDASNLHPALSVVDIDQDGLDDLYVMVRWGKNLLLRNQGDGTFTEIASSLGLDIQGRCTSGIFADFDNDGDLDLMLGRSLERSLYLVNENGRFIDRSSALVSEPLPYLVTSMSAVDYNQDGLLDIYFSTYSPSNLGDRVVGNQTKARDWAPDFLPPEQAEEVSRRTPQGHRWLADVGPPNVLLKNQGNGRFAVAKESRQLAVWRNTFQATWSDFDNDGDPDLYVANDFAPDHLFQNDGPHGFVDITQQYGITEMGFAMGASWGDYDNDGRMDLYVSNMYSKAGRRSTAQIPGLDRRFAQMAEGNYLYRNLGDRFQKKSGLEPPELTVAQAGWAWGGQFVDFDNDGNLDIYVSSGFYTAPKEVESQVDL